MLKTKTLLVALLAAAAPVAADETGLANIDHVVFFMQENRAFNHYFGTMAGVRGFKDPNVGYNGEKSMFYQKTGNPQYPYLLPFYLGDDTAYKESNQCVIGGSNDWAENHQAWNHGKNDAWVTNNTALSWGYYKRDDLPYHFEMVEGWTVGDMYAESVIGPTCPNRATWVSGTINAVGSPVGNYTKMGGQFIENWLNDGCEVAEDGSTYACFPLRWKTLADHLEEAGIDWFVYQQAGDFSDNPFQWWTQFQDPEETNPLIKKGMSFAGMEGFYEAANNGTLPPVSWVIGPFEMSEHPPHRPVDGAWLTNKIINAVVDGPSYNKTAIFVSYDETGGFGDHVLPFVSPEGTEGEWIKDPKNTEDTVPTGPGFRVPFYVISPFTRGGNVFTEPSDHNSQILFLEKWIKARFGKEVKQNAMNTWRREHMSDLINMFDFENPDYTIPKLMDPPMPRFVNGFCQSSFDCRRAWRSQAAGPPIPLGQQTEEHSLYTEVGYKKARGRLTEGRHLVLERVNHDKDNRTTRLPTLRHDASSKGFYSDGGCKNYECPAERFILYQGDHGSPFEDVYHLKSAITGKFLCPNANPTGREKAGNLTIDYDPPYGYTIKRDDKYLDFDYSSLVQPQFQDNKVYFNIYAVTY